MTARRLFIILITVAVLLTVYVIYGYLSDIPTIELKSGSGSSDANVYDPCGKMGKIGTTSVGTITKAVYTDLDENKNVKREFGFERLIHESGSEWTIEKPYMNIIERDFVCGITADSGRVQVEIAAARPVPKDARLSGNVVIHILPEKNARMSESFIYLDDISFVSEKSLFTTDGPVRFVSDDAEMSGRGLEVVYNTGRGRLELMHLLKMEYLRIKTFKESVFADGKDSSRKDSSPKDSSLEEKGKTAKQADESYYRCTLNKNVVINYGSQAVLADEVTISNLFWPKNKSRSDKKNSISASEAAKGNKTDENTSEKIIPIEITCEDGIIVRPMEEQDDLAKRTEQPQRLLEFAGAPVTIMTSDEPFDRKNADGDIERKVLAECGWLKYNLDLGVLDMFSGDPPQNVSLHLEKDGSMLKTADSLHWSLKERTAVIKGPGTLYLAQKDKNGHDKARMDFGGTMNVYFADQPQQRSLRQSVSLKSVNIVGGFTAQMQRQKTQLAADFAAFDFTKQNSVSQAKLDGNVKLSSDAGSLSSKKAKVLFEADNAVSQADFGGDVRFSSDNGLLKSENAKVFFAKDSKGDMYASKVESSGNVEITPVVGKGLSPQGVFRAQRIDYDVPAGHAVAQGPVELVYNDPNGTPANIKAKKRAEYFIKSNEVVFEGEVAGKMQRAGVGAAEYTEFTGDKLTAKLGQAAKNALPNRTTSQSRIERIGITGDIVKFESYRKNGDELVGGVKLKCRQVDYESDKNEVWASGGRDCFVLIDNSKAPRSSSGSRFNLKGPCYARLWDFDKLRWSMADDKIMAEGIPSGMHLAYLPAQGDKYDKKVQIDAGDVRIDLSAAADGRKEVSALEATGGIHFLEEDGYEFYGSRLIYDSVKSIVAISGSQAKPCMVNGMIVDGITYNLSDGSIQAPGFRGGTLPLPQKR